MIDFLKKIVSSIVENPDKFEIKNDSDNGLNIYTILVPEEEIGKIIGKEGKTINAIRCLCRLKSMNNQEKALVKVDKLAA